MRLLWHAYNTSGEEILDYEAMYTPCNSYHDHITNLALLFPSAPDTPAVQAELVTGLATTRCQGIGWVCALDQKQSLLQVAIPAHDLVNIT